jgi:hypothetical protein
MVSKPREASCKTLNFLLPDGMWPPWKGSSFQFVLEVVLLATGMGIIIGTP